jgi:hypothetical protein
MHLPTRPHLPKRRLQKCRTSGKIKYSTEQAAHDRIEILRIIGAVWRQERAAYRCRFCGSWHLTSK